MYRESKWMDAAAELRVAQEAAENLFQWSEALYWVVMAELSASDYSSALYDMDELERKAPLSSRAVDINYHRGRAYYFMGYYEDAIGFFKSYADRSGAGQSARKAASLFWIGECLLPLGQLDRAADFFTEIVTKYPNSAKFEAATYRLDLIKQKKIESELLSLLKWSHEESLRTVEEYQRREKVYEQTMNSYQRRLADVQQPSTEKTPERTDRTPDRATIERTIVDKTIEEYRRQLSEAQERIRSLEARLQSIQSDSSDSSSGSSRPRIMFMGTP